MELVSIAGYALLAEPAPHEVGEPKRYWIALERDGNGGRVRVELSRNTVAAGEIVSIRGASDGVAAEWNAVEIMSRRELVAFSAGAPGRFPFTVQVVVRLPAE